MRTMSAERPERRPLPGNFIGNRRELAIWRFGRAGARPKIYLQAALHASEMTGVMALHHLVGLLEIAEREERIQGEIVVVPLANPIGLAEYSGGAQDGRFEQLSHANYNRGFPEVSGAVAAEVSGRLGADPAANSTTIRDAALSIIRGTMARNDLEALKLTLLELAVDADVVLDLHSDRVAAMFAYVNAVDWPGLADLAAWLGFAATIAYAPYVPSTTFAGVTGSLFPRLAEHFGPAVPLACQSAMIEMRGQHVCNDVLGAEDAGNLFSFMVGRGAIAGTVACPPLLADATPIEGMDVGYAPHAGLLTFHKQPGVWVQSGEVISDVIDPTRPFASARTTVRARGSGVLYARGLDGTLTYPGQVLFRIACAEPLAHRTGKSWLDD
jgi:predicted deacylase